MYFPYLRGKQYELSALRDYVINNHKHNKVIPVIEPVKDKLLPLEKTISEYENYNTNLCLIVNPLVGDLASSPNTLNEKIMKIVLSHKNVIPSLLLTTETLAKTIDKFIDQYSRVCLISIDTIPTSTPLTTLKTSSKVQYHIFSSNINRSYRKETAKPDIAVLLNDSFPMEKKNADYPDDNPFSDEIFFYAEELRSGFSDYTLLPNEYNDTGGPAWAVTIHLSYEIKDREIRVRHFTSDVTNTNTDPGGKFLQALKKLIKWSDKNQSLVYESSGMKELRSYYNREHFPGLGYLKKISILHHIELCNNIMNR